MEATGEGTVSVTGPDRSLAGLFGWASGTGEYDVPSWYTDRALDSELAEAPCPMCGSRNACSFDELGRPLIHALDVED